MQAQREIYRIIGLQCALVLLITLGLVFYRPISALGFLMGGFSSILPNIFFVYRLFKSSYPKTGKALVKSLYAVELQKLAFSIGLLLIAIIRFPPNAFAILIGFLVAHWSLWPSVFFFRRSESNE